MQIEIINWEKYNSKEFKTKYPHWFRLNKDILSSESLFGMTAEERWVWVTILCFACKKRSGSFKCDIQYLSNQASVSKEIALSAIEKLITSSALRVEGEFTRVDSSLHNRQYNTEQTDITITPKKKVTAELATVKSSEPPPASNIKNSVFMELLEKSKIKQSTLKLWVETYKDRLWIETELLKATAWLDSNPRQSRSPADFFGRWLSRAAHYKGNSKVGMDRTKEQDDQELRDHLRNLEGI